ncbi:MAG TPA: YncE family protein [Bryobacteraceae bacterium]|nr:YncE family protein [Bryobacteraceae bacterium]
MMIRLSRSAKFMCAGIALSLGWFVLESCDCDETKEQNFPGFWVACIANKPTLMTYNDNNATVVTSDAAGNFNPAEYDCSHSGSPQYKGSEASSPFKISSPAGPGGFDRRPHATGSGTVAYVPPLLRIFPFMPHAIPPATANCDSTFPDIFQTDHAEALVTRVSTCPFAIKIAIPVATRPLQVAVTPDGSTALVTSFDNAVNFIDLATNKVTYTLLTDSTINPHGLAISPDGTRAYITSFNTNGVIAVIDLASKKIIATIPTISYAQGLTLTPDGSQLWVTSPLAASVDIFDTLTNTRVTGLNISETIDVAFNSTGTRAYVTTSSTIPGSVVAVDTATYQTIKSYTVGLGPSDIAMAYGDQFLVINNNSDGSISVLDLAKDAVVTTKVGTNSVPSGIAFVH